MKRSDRERRERNVEDEIFRAAARMLEERDALADPRWEAFAAGTLSEADEAALRALAERSEEARHMLETLTPLDEARVAEVTACLAQASHPPVPDAASTTASGPKPRPAPVPPRPRWARWRPLLVAAILVVAVLALRPRPSQPLPQYTVVAAGGEQVALGPPAAPETPVLRLGPGGHLEITLRPASDVTGPVTVTAALVQGDRVLGWDPPVEVTPSGVARIVAARDALPGAASGEWEIVLAVGRPDALPRSPEALARIPATPDGAGLGSVRVFRVRLVLDGREGLLPLEYWGCRAVRRGPLCEVAPEGETTVRLALPVRVATMAVFVDGKPRGATPAAPEDDTRVDVRVGPGDRTLLVLADAGGTPRSFRLDLAPQQASPALDQAAMLRKAGRIEEAEAALDALQNDASPAVRARASGMLARIARRRDETPRAIERFRQAIRLDTEAGLVSDEVDDRCALAMTLSENERRFGDARTVLDEVTSLEGDYPAGRIIAAYYRGVEPFETGDLRAALRLFRDEARGARRLGLTSYVQSAATMEADVLASLGRVTEARDQHRALREDAARPEADRCAEAHVLDNAAWFLLRAGSTLPDREDPVPLLRKALSLYLAACPEPANLANVHTNLALAALAHGERTEVRRAIDEARKAQPEPALSVRVWLSLAEAHLAFAEGRVQEALATFDQVAELARANALSDAALDASLGRAASLVDLARPSEARAAYAATDGLLDAQSALVPLGEGKETFLGRQQVTRDRLHFLMQIADRSPAETADAWQEAADAARRGRRRILAATQWVDRLHTLPPDARVEWQRTMDAYRARRADLDRGAEGLWKLSTEERAKALAARAAEHARLRALLDEALARLDPQGTSALPEPGEGELLLAYAPLRVGWAGFAITSHALRAHRIDRLDPRAPGADQILEPFRDEIQRAARIRLLPAGPLEQASLHTLPWEGRPLAAQIPVTYGVDLAPRRTAPAPSSPPLALLVSDARRDVPAVTPAVEAAKHALAERGFRVEVLDGAAATHDAVLAVLDRHVALLYYVGHGLLCGALEEDTALVSRPDGPGAPCADGLAHALALAKGGWLTTGDILALRHAPEHVVLVSCNAARTSGADGASGLGLAQAFVAAGARSVVASVRPVDTKFVDPLTRKLLDGASGLDFAAALQRAHAASEPGDWASVRVLVP